MSFASNLRIRAGKSGFTLHTIDSEEKGSFFACVCSLMTI